jgi:hypothetical protein
LVFRHFNPAFLLSPESILLNLAGDLAAPLVNKKAIQARYNMASAMQVQAVYQYEQTVLFAYTDVLNQLNKLENYANSFAMKQREVDLFKQVGQHCKQPVQICQSRLCRGTPDAGRSAGRKNGIGRNQTPATSSQSRGLPIPGWGMAVKGAFPVFFRGDERQKKHLSLIIDRFLKDIFCINDQVHIPEQSLSFCSIVICIIRDLR